MDGFHLSTEKRIALAAVILATAAAVWFFYFRKDDATAVRARIHAAAAFVEKQPAGSGRNLQGVGAAHALGDFFTEETDVSISAESQGQTHTLSADTRAQLVSTYFLLRPMLASLSVALSDIEVDFPDDSRRTASVKCSATATGTAKDSGPFRETRAVAAELVRGDDGEWRFRSLRAEPDYGFD